MREQNNYIDFLRESTILKQQMDLKPVFDSSDYIKFKTHGLANTIPNSKNSFSQLLLNNKKNVFGMERNTNNCSNFILCRNTNYRTNRVLNSLQLPVETFRLNKNNSETNCECKENNH
jgi:hypothetical protein